MAQVNKQPILVGNRGIGNVWVDGGAVRGEGGPLRPRLVVPLTIGMDSMPAESMLVVTRVDARLTTEQNAFSQNSLSEVAKDLTNGFHARSHPNAPNEMPIDLRFFLTGEEVEHLESVRHSSRESIFTLYVGLDMSVAGMKTYNEMRPGNPPEESPWDFNYGMFTQLFPFWTCQVTPVQVHVEPSTWIERVLPGLGYDQLRLLELIFPPPLPEHTSAAKQFDKAKRALDERRYGDCILECRGLLNMWEKQYGATQKVRLAELVAMERDWSQQDRRRQLLDTLWREVGDVANAPHHPEGDHHGEFDSRDARLLLILTAALSEYVSRR